MSTLITDPRKMEMLLAFSKAADKHSPTTAFLANALTIKGVRRLQDGFFIHNNQVL